uniref:Uncharacterized protein n=1 Tax=Panagrolaimus davidi TaxID=227884 RepID=A0A914PFZ7_9BILA
MILDFLAKEKHCDSDFISWKAYLEKAEKDHPSADIRELLKFISHDMMFFGTFKEVLSLDIELSKLKRCEMDDVRLDDVQLSMVPRKEEPENHKQKNNFFQLWFAEKKSNLLLKKLISSSFLKMDSSSNCTAEVQAIIDKIEKMGVSSEQEWVRLCNDELKTNLKSQNSYVNKLEVKTQMAAFVLEVTNKMDLYFCDKNPKSRRCHNCEYTTPTSYINVNYLGE